MISHLHLLSGPAEVMDLDIRVATIRTGASASLVSVAALWVGDAMGAQGWGFELVSVIATGVFALAIARYSQNKGHSCCWGLLAFAGPVGGVMAGKLPDRTRGPWAALPRRECT